MTRNEWISDRFSIIDPKLRQHYLNERARYCDRDFNRGWRASYVEELGDDAWLNELEPASSVESSIAKWCQENCIGRWDSVNTLWWEFELDMDAMAFKLMWS